MHGEGGTARGAWREVHGEAHLELGFDDAHRVGRLHLEHKHLNLLAVLLEQYRVALAERCVGVRERRLERGLVVGNARGEGVGERLVKG